MEPLAGLEAACREFDRRLQPAVDGDAWATPTPCEGWTVQALFEHVVRGNVMAARLLAGASKEDSLAPLEEPLAALVARDPVAAFASSAEQQAAAFRTEGAVERIVHHPAMDMPGGQLLGFRTADLALHAWDLARALGIDEELAPEVVQSVWAMLEPMAPFIGQIGVFGSGPTGTVPDDAPLQTRLLDMSGRRP